MKVKTFKGLVSFDEAKEQLVNIAKLIKDMEMDDMHSGLIFGKRLDSIKSLTKLLGEYRKNIDFENMKSGVSPSLLETED